MGECSRIKLAPARWELLPNSWFSTALGYAEMSSFLHPLTRFFRNDTCLQRNNFLRLLPTQRKSRAQRHLCSFTIFQSGSTTLFKTELSVSFITHPKATPTIAVNIASLDFLIATFRSCFCGTTPLGFYPLASLFSTILTLLEVLSKHLIVTILMFDNVLISYFETLLAGVAGDKTTVLFSNLVALLLNIRPLIPACNLTRFFQALLSCSTSACATKSHQVARSTFCLEIFLPKAGSSLVI